MRKRDIRPGFFRNEDLFELEQATGLPIRVAFAGLWCAADREGRFLWKPLKLKRDILPYDALDFATVLAALASCGFIVRYEKAGVAYGWIPTFHRHQHPHPKESTSQLPEPPALTDKVIPGVDPGSTLGRTQVIPRVDPRLTPGGYPSRASSVLSSSSGSDHSRPDRKVSAQPDGLRPASEPESPFEPEEPKPPTTRPAGAASDLLAYFLRRWSEVHGCPPPRGKDWSSASLDGLSRRLAVFGSEWGASAAIRAVDDFLAETHASVAAHSPTMLTSSRLEGYRHAGRRPEPKRDESTRRLGIGRKLNPEVSARLAAQEPPSPPCTRCRHDWHEHHRKALACASADCACAGYLAPVSNGTDGGPS